MAYDHLDEQLVNALLDDGRATLSGLADTVNASVTTVSNHLHRLEQEGYIHGIVPKIDYGAFGYDVTTITHLKLDGEARQSTTEWLLNQAQFMSVYEVTGDHDIVVIGTFRDTDDMNTHLKRVLRNPSIQETNTSVVLSVIRNYEQFPVSVDEG